MLTSLTAIVLLLLAADAPTAAAEPAVSAASTVDDQLRRGQNEYAYGNYNKAAELLAGLLYPMRVYSQEQLLVTRLYLGLSFYLLGERENAEEEFTKMLYIEPDYAMDPFTFAPGMLDLLEEVRAAHSPQLNAIRERNAQKIREQQEQDINLARPSVVTVVRTENSDALTFLPFGAGQFQNGDHSWGMAFAVSQAILLGVNVGSYLFLRNLRVNGQPGFTPERANSVRSVTILQVGSAALFGVAWSLGVFHARLNFVPIIERRSLAQPQASSAALPLLGWRPALNLRWHF